MRHATTRPFLATVVATAVVKRNPMKSAGGLIRPQEGLLLSPSWKTAMYSQVKKGKTPTQPTSAKIIFAVRFSDSRTKNVV